ncbi:MAG: cyclohydrolase [Rhodospirillaceae bacterium]|jgi:GTP cyclohydrolase II|nr:cyclohydrolase [Rhodospirillaceae bacterium]
MPESLAHSPEPVDRRGLVAVDRAIAELRRGAPVVVGDGAAAAVVLAAEMAEVEGVGRLLALAGGSAWLALTAQRAAVLGLTTGTTPAAGRAVATLLPIGAAGDAESLRRLADPTTMAPVYGLPATVDTQAAFAAYARAAIELAKLARLLPAAIFGMLPAERSDHGIDGAGTDDLLSVGVGQIAGYEILAARSLTPVSEARVPLAGAEATRIIAFRPADGGVEHLAIIIGDPPVDRPALTRLHSACFTGDLLGSLRCDCGEQLKGAIAEIARQGSGLLLYLAQEGRGIGLVNKLRAYRLQDRGADTVDANLQLGFDADERIYLPAAEMLRQLGYPAVRLMTNNPEKVAGLARSGIAVVERVPHVFPSNQHNEGYLETKANRFGHMF